MSCAVTTWLVLITLVAVIELAALVVLTVRSTRLRREHLLLLQSIRTERPESGVRAGAQKAVQLAVKTASRLRSGGLGGVLTGSLDDVVRWANDDRTAIVRVATPEGLVTFMFTDIEDSTATNERLGDRAWLRVLRAHDQLVRGLVDHHGGHVVKSQGDGFMIVFGAPDTAVAAASDIQRTLSEHPPRALRSNPIRLRIGMHVGTAVARDGDYFGRNVALAARVAGEAGGGEIVASDETFAALTEEPHPAWSREVRLKGFSDEHTLHALDWRGSGS